MFEGQHRMYVKQRLFAVWDKGETKVVREHSYEKMERKLQNRLYWQLEFKGCVSDGDCVRRFCIEEQSQPQMEDFKTNTC